MNSIRKRNTLAAVAVALAAVLAIGSVVLVLQLTPSGNGVKADSPHPGLDFHMGIDLEASHDTNPLNDVCSSAGNVTPPPTCNLTLGSRIRVNVYLDSRGTLTDYGGTESSITFTGVTTKSDCIFGTADPGESSPCADANPWPDCAIEVTAASPGFVNVGCSLGIGASFSTYTGMISTFGFTCTANGSFRLDHFTVLINTGLIDSSYVEHSEAGPDELNVNCAAAADTPTPTPTLTPTLTPTPTDTPNATPTNTPNPNPRMRLSLPDLTCVGENEQLGIPLCQAKLFAGDNAANKRADFIVRASDIFDTTNLSRGGFRTQVDLSAGLGYTARSCSTEVVWAPEASCTTSTVSPAGSTSVRHSVRTSAGPPFSKTTQAAGPLVELKIHCTKAGQQTITLKSPSGSDPGSVFVLTSGSETAAKPENPPDIDVFHVQCNPQTPEMSLNASGPGVTCVAAPVPSKPDKCTVPFDAGAAAVQTPFNISVSANVIPANATPESDGYGGFDSNVFFGGLTYVVPKPSCLTEVIWPDRLLCQQAPAVVATFKQHFPRLSLFPPYQPPSHYAGELVRMSLKCPSLGQFRLVLNGSSTNFVNQLGTAVPVATIANGPLDPLAAATVVVPIVDAMLINCEIVPTPTPTSTPTSTASATATPCPTGGCPTSTPTATPTATATPTSPPTSTPSITPTRTQTSTPSMTPTITPTPTPCCDHVDETLLSQGKVSTGSVATGTDVVETSVQIRAANGGQVKIDEVPILHAPPANFTFFGQEVAIVAPPASNVQNPLIIMFTLDASIIPTGQNENTVQVFRDGVIVPNCTGPSGTASPNPCISHRTKLVGGADTLNDVELIVLSRDASSWNFGAVTGGGPPGVLGDVDCSGQLDPIDAQLILQFVAGIIDSLPCPQNADVNHDGSITSTDALLILQLIAGIIDSFPAGP